MLLIAFETSNFQLFLCLLNSCLTGTMVPWLWPSFKFVYLAFANKQVTWVKINIFCPLSIGAYFLTFCRLLCHFISVGDRGEPRFLSFFPIVTTKQWTSEPSRYVKSLKFRKQLKACRPFPTLRVVPQRSPKKTLM